jgi:hypothetical protein
MAKLTSAQRKALPNSEFAAPSQRKYPVDTPGRAANAKARATQMAKRGKLSPAAVSRIKAKANSMLKDGCC